MENLIETSGLDFNLLSSVIDYNKRKYQAFKNGEYFELEQEYERILSARYMKVSRLKKRFIYLVSRFDYIYFCTFTFDDDTINKCDRTKRDLIKNTLNLFSSDIHYILNVDYGKKNEREHYHCLIGTNNNDDLRKFIKNKYPFFTSVDLCKHTGTDIKRLSKYINKLSNHCIKDTTKNKRIVYNFKGYDNLDTYLAKIAYTFDKYKLSL